MPQPAPLSSLVTVLAGHETQQVSQTCQQNGMAVYNLMQLLEVIFKTKEGILTIYSFDTCDKGEKVLFPCCIPAYGLGLQGSYCEW